MLQIGTVCSGKSCATPNLLSSLPIPMQKILLKPRCVSLGLESIQGDSTLCSLRPGGLRYLQDSNDDSKQPYGTAKDFHNQDLDEEAGILGISQGSPAAHDAHTDPTEEIA